MRILATLPTFNEAENIRPLIEELLRISPDFEVLVVDDDSPDGTWRVVEEMAAAEPRVHVLHRTHERGRGTAGRDGFQWAVDHGAELVVEMDADHSHHPQFIPTMLQAAENGTEVIIGSRLIPGGGEVGRGVARRVITVLANLYIRLVLWLPIRDCTTGFRVFRGSLLQRIPWQQIRSTGPEIVQEVLMFARARGARFKEVPIVFEERATGHSTFTAKIALRSLWSVLRFRFRRYS